MGSIAKEYLSQIQLFDVHITNMLDELKNLRDMTTKITTTTEGEVVSGSHNQDRLGDAIAKIIDLEKEIDSMIDTYVDYKKFFINIIRKVNDPNQANVLYKHYFQYMSLERISCDMGYTYRNVCYIHGRALQAVEALVMEGGASFVEGCKKQREAES